MAQFPRYPEHEIIEYGDDLNGHLEMHSSMGVFITGVGIIPDSEGNLVTFDRPQDGLKPLIPAELPQASVIGRDTSSKYNLQHLVEESIAERLDLPEEIEFEIIGNTYAFGQHNHINKKHRIYIPVLHLGITDIEIVKPAYDMKNMVMVPRKPEEIIEIIDFRDETEGILGQRNRAVTRFAIDAYIDNVL